MTRRVTTAYVVVLSLAAVVLTIMSVGRITRWLDLACFAILIAFADYSRPRISGSTSVTLSSVLVVASYLVFGPWALLAVLVGVFAARLDQTLERRAFNVAQTVICTFVGGAVYQSLGGVVGDLSKISFPYIVLPITAAGVAYLLVNIALMEIVLRLQGQRQFPTVRMAVEVFVSQLGYSYLGFLLGLLWLGQLGPFAAVLMLAPLQAANWAFAQYEAERKAHEATLRSLAQAIETKDLYTRGHGERVSRGARMLGSELGWRGDRLEALAEAGLLHDVGKIGVPTRVLQKDGKLTAAEYAAIKLHPLRGVEVVGDITFLEDARAGIMHHHEKFDGSGYPSGLKGTDIPEFARILGVADAFDSMTSLRSYRAPRPIVDALEELIRCKGTHFDPDLVDGFVASIKRDGWEAAPIQPIPRDAPAATYDHDDPTRPPQVEDAQGPGR
jgi:HD domain